VWSKIEKSSKKDLFLVVFTWSLYLGIHLPLHSAEVAEAA